MSPARRQAHRPRSREREPAPHEDGRNTPEYGQDWDAEVRPEPVDRDHALVASEPTTIDIRRPRLPPRDAGPPGGAPPGGSRDDRKERDRDAEDRGSV